MRVIYQLKNKISGVCVLAITFLTLTSCGMYQQATYDDGIYSSDQESVQTTETVNTSNDPYQNYFEQKSLEAEDRYGAIFTDVDSYSSQDYADPEVNVNTIGYTESYAAWGQDTEDITINVYAGTGLGFSPFGVGLWNRGFWGNQWGWNGGWGFGWGWNNWGWNNGWGWNAGLCGPFYGGGFWNGGFYSPYFRNGYNRYAYNTGRRNYANRASSRRSNYYSRTANQNNTRYSNSRSSRRTNNAVRSTRNTRTNSMQTTRSSRSNSGQVRSTSRSRGSGSFNSNRSSSSSRGSSVRSSGGSRSSGASRGGSSRRGGR